jgi:hypothetical protein
MYGVGFGYSVIGATTVSSGGGAAYDTDAQAFFTANSTLIDVTQKNAINQWYINAKANGYYNDLGAFYFLFLGDSTRNSYNGKNPATFQLSFSSGWTFSSSGSTGNGTSTYASLGATQSSFMASGSGHMAIYSRSIGVNNQYDMGNYAGSGYTSMRLTDNLSIHINTTGTPFATSNTNGGKGFFIGSRISSTNLIQSKNATQYTATSSEAYSVGNIVIGAIGTLGLPQFYSNKEYSMASIGLGLSSSKMTSYYNDVNTLMTTLGINV